MKSVTTNIPTIITIFGITGDLSKRKIIPSLYHLYSEKRLPSRLSIIGFSRRHISDKELRDYIFTILKKHKAITNHTKRYKAFSRLFSYHKGNFTERTAYKRLVPVLQKIDDAWGTCSNKLFYFAVPPDYYESIIKHLATTKLSKSCDEAVSKKVFKPIKGVVPKARENLKKTHNHALTGWTRIIVEKPFGKDKKNAKRLDVLLAKRFHEEQIYRIDHYIAKDVLQNVLHFRFTNTLFESHWDNSIIESIHVKLAETIGVDTRGLFYDEVGALRDVGQNHLLQMLASVIMNRPLQFSASDIREARAHALSKVQTMTPKAIDEKTERAQYVGYKNIPGVSKQSKTETYFKIRTNVKMQGWEGVQIILEAGKKMKKKEKYIEVVFKHPSPCLCEPGSPHMQDRIVFEIAPQEQISIYVWSKKPGLDIGYEEKVLKISLGLEKAHGRDSYEKLLLDCIAGDQTLFLSTDEIQEMWSFVDPIITHWGNSKKAIPRYASGKK